jgi:hypothetical protein
MVLRTALWSPSADAAAIARQELDKVAATRAGAVALGPEQLAAFGESLDLGAAA